MFRRSTKSLNRKPATRGSVSRAALGAEGGGERVRHPWSGIAEITRRPSSSSSPSKNFCKRRKRHLQVIEPARKEPISSAGVLMSHHKTNRTNAMGNLLHYAIVFLVVALVAAFLGFGGVAGTAMEGARLLFWVAIVLFVVSLVAGMKRRA